MKSRIKALALMITVLVILITIVLLGISRRSFYIVILGENPVTIYEGTSYEEPGYFAYDSNDQDVTSMVKIESDLNPSQEGNYKIKSDAFALVSNGNELTIESGLIQGIMTSKDLTINDGAQIISNSGYDAVNHTKSSAFRSTHEYCEPSVYQQNRHR